MSSAEHIDDDGIDEGIHADYLFVDFLMQCDQIRMLHADILKSFGEEACVYDRFRVFFFCMAKPLECVGAFVEYEKIEHDANDNHRSYGQEYHLKHMILQ